MSLRGSLAAALLVLGQTLHYAPALLTGNEDDTTALFQHSWEPGEPRKGRLRLTASSDASDDAQLARWTKASRAAFLQQARADELPTEHDGEEPSAAPTESSGLEVATAYVSLADGHGDDRAVASNSTGSLEGPQDPGAELKHMNPEDKPRVEEMPGLGDAARQEPKDSKEYPQVLKTQEQAPEASSGAVAVGGGQPESGTTLKPEAFGKETQSVREAPEGSIDDAAPGVNSLGEAKMDGEVQEGHSDASMPTAADVSIAGGGEPSDDGEGALKEADPGAEMQTDADKYAAELAKGIIHLTVKDPQGKELKLKQKKRAFLKLVMTMATNRLGMLMDMCRFTHNGTELDATSTPELSGLQDQDVIEVALMTDEELAALQVKKRAAKAEAEAKRKADAAAKLKAEEDAKLRMEEQAARKAEEQAKRQAEIEVKRKAIEQAKQKAEEDRQRVLERMAQERAEVEARRKEQAEEKKRDRDIFKRQLEEKKKHIELEKAQLRAEEEAKRLAKVEAEKLAQEEARQRAEEEATREAEQLARAAKEEERRQRSEELERRKAEQAKKRAERAEELKAAAEAKRREKEVATRKAEEEKRAKFEEEDRVRREAKRQADEARQQAEEEARRQLEERNAERKAAEEARRQADEQAKAAKVKKDAEELARRENDRERRRIMREEQYKSLQWAKQAALEEEQQRKEEERAAAAEAAQRKAEEDEARRKIEEEARQRAEEEALLVKNAGPEFYEGPAPDDEHLYLYVRTPGSTIQLRVGKAFKMRVVLLSACKRLGFEAGGVHFEHDGVGIVLSDTVSDVGLQHLDTLELADGPPPPDEAAEEARRNITAQLEERRQETERRVAEKAESFRLQREEARRVAEQKAAAQREARAQAEAAARLAAEEAARLRAEEEVKRKAAVEEARQQAALQRAKEEADADLAAGNIHLLVRGPEDQEMPVKARNTSRLRAVLSTVCKRFNLQPDNLRVAHNSTLLDMQDTLEMLGLQDQDTIDIRAWTDEEVTAQLARKRQEEEQEEARKKQEQDKARREAEEAQAKAHQEAELAAAKKRAEEEAREKAEKEALAQRKAAEAKAKKEERLRAEEAARQKLLEEKQRRQEEEKQRRSAKEEAAARALQEKESKRAALRAKLEANKARKAAFEEAKRKEEEAKQRAEEEALRRAQEDAAFLAKEDAKYRLRLNASQQVQNDTLGGSQHPETVVTKRGPEPDAAVSLLPAVAEGKFKSHADARQTMSPEVRERGVRSASSNDEGADLRIEKVQEFGNDTENGTVARTSKIQEHAKPSVVDSEIRPPAERTDRPAPGTVTASDASPAEDIS